MGWLLSLSCIILPVIIRAVPWDINNDPHRWGQEQYELDVLPMVGSSTKQGWSSSYWPNKNGGIAHRWAYGSETPTFNYQLNSLASLSMMSLEQLKILSPAEKYDIINNRLDYPTVLSEWRRTSPFQPRWYGICHGWAPASILYQEPNPVVFTGSNGIAVPFGTADVEALLSYFLAMYGSLGLKMLGTRCQTDFPCPNDMNAGALMVLLGNELGLKGNMMIFDIDPGVQVWNQPITQYTCSKQDMSTDSRARVTCTISYITETVPTWTPHPPKINTETYDMILELNDGDITGGSYITGGNLRWPDYAWQITNPPPFSGYFSMLGPLYRASIQGGASSATVPATPTLSTTSDTGSGNFYNDIPRRSVYIPGGTSGTTYGGRYMDTTDAHNTTALLSPVYTPETEAFCSPNEEFYAPCAPSVGGYEPERCNGTVEFERMEDQVSPMCAIWKVFCPLGYTTINVTFTDFNVTNLATEVKIYEAIDGPLYTVLTGYSEVDKPLDISASAIRVVFESVARNVTSEHFAFTYDCLM